MLQHGQALVKRNFREFYRVSGEPISVTARVAIAASAARSMTHGSLYLCDAILDRLAQYFQDMPPELRQLIEKEHAVVGQ
jgi:hypothetical protein